MQWAFRWRSMFLYNGEAIYDFLLIYVHPFNEVETRRTKDKCMQPQYCDWPTVNNLKNPIIKITLLSQQRLGRLREDKLRFTQNRTRHPNGLHPRAHPARQQHRVQDQRRHSKGLHQDDEQGLSLAHVTTPLNRAFCFNSTHFCLHSLNLRPDNKLKLTTYSVSSVLRHFCSLAARIALYSSILYLY